MSSNYSEQIKIEPNTAFVWEKGVRLKATERVVINFPAALIGDDEVIGSVIEFSDDDTLIELQHSEDMEKLTGIKVDLQKGQMLCLNKRTEAMILSNLAKPVIFDKVS